MIESNEETPGEAESSKPAPCCNSIRVARALVGTLLLTVMLGNLVVYASPEWAARIGSLLGETNRCSSGGCPAGACCPEMTGVGLPASVLESNGPTDSEAVPQESAAEQSED